ncbi:MAG: hypothetical protein AAF223_15715 [Bacteroidota bacterium]
MKLIQFFSILLLAVSFSACPSDDDLEPAIAEVEGTYRLTFYEYTSTALHEVDGEWVASALEEPGKAVDIDMTVTFHSDGTFLAEGGYTGQGVMASKSNYRIAGKWKIEGNKLYFSDDGFLDHQISFNPWTHVLVFSDEEFPIDGLNILGVTNTKITLELISNKVFTLSGIPRQWKSIGTVVLEK